MATITTLDGVPLAEMYAGDDNPDAALCRAIELAGEHGGAVVLEDGEGSCVVRSDGSVETYHGRN